MEVEENKQLQFFDVLIKKKLLGGVTHTVYSRPTHTNWNLNGNSYHHPRELLSAFRALATRSPRLSDKDHKEKTDFLRLTLGQNGYFKEAIKYALKPSRPRKNITDTDTETTNNIHYSTLY